MTELRKQAAEALRPFAALADKLDSGKVHANFRKAGFVPLAIGGVGITTDDLRRARDTLAVLEAKPKRD